VKYILCSLESKLSDSFHDFETDSGTIEHILPENPTDEWEESIPRNKWDDFIYKLGNLTLLKASTNRDIGTKPYVEKRKSYESSEYLLTKDIAELASEEWNTALLTKRQKNMAEIAKRIWRSDFGDKTP
jgi:hypothetical protein